MSMKKRLQAIEAGIVRRLLPRCVSAYHREVLGAVPTEALPAIAALFEARNGQYRPEDFDEALVVTFGGLGFDQEQVNRWMTWWERGDDPSPPAEPATTYDTACYLSGVPQQFPLAVALGYVVEMMTAARLHKRITA